MTRSKNMKRYVSLLENHNNTEHEMLTQTPNSELLKRLKIFIYIHRFFSLFCEINKGHLNEILKYIKIAFDISFCLK